MLYTGQGVYTTLEQQQESFKYLPTYLSILGVVWTSDNGVVYRFRSKIYLLRHESA